MYRGSEPAFCRQCGGRWLSGSANCIACGEPSSANTDARRALPKFRPQDHQLKWIKWSTWLQLGMGLALCSCPILAYLGADSETSEGTDLWNGLVVVCEMLAWVVGIALTSGWLFEVGRNLRALGRTNLGFSDEGRVLWRFVPLANWLMHYRSWYELWQASQPLGHGDSWKYLPVAKRLLLWSVLSSLALCLRVITVVFLVKFGISEDSGDVDQTSALIALCGLLMIPLTNVSANFLYCGLVARINAWQNRSAEILASTTAARDEIAAPLHSI